MNDSDPVPTLPEAAQARLELLRGLHAPEPINAFPPAPGWWILAAICVVVASVGILLAYRRRHSMRTRALEELRAIERDTAGTTLSVRAMQVSNLLRRYALFLFPRRQVAGLTGERWLDFLNTVAPEAPFGARARLGLLELPFAGEHAEAGEDQFRELLKAARQWLTRAEARDA